jgi:hypothetical protein
MSCNRRQESVCPNSPIAYRSIKPRAASWWRSSLRVGMSRRLDRRMTSPPLDSESREALPRFSRMRRALLNTCFGGIDAAYGCNVASLTAQLSKLIDGLQSQDEQAADKPLGDLLIGIPPTLQPHEGEHGEAIFARLFGGHRHSW